MELDLDLTDRTVDLIAEGFDMAIRIGVLADSTLVARRLVPMRLLICAAPGYLQTPGVPRSVVDLKQHACLLYRHSAGVSWNLTVAGRTQAVMMTGAYRANNGEVLRDAAIAGLGLAQLPDFLLGTALSDGRLVTVLDDHAPPPGGAWSVYPAHRQRSPTVRAMTDYLTERLLPAGSANEVNGQ